MRVYTWASSIVPRSRMVHRVCSTCGAVEHYPSGAFDVVVEGGIRYPDVLGCGAYPFLIVSEAVVAAWHTAGITSFDIYPVTVIDVRSSALRSVAPPAYFRIEIKGTCQIDLEASAVKLVRICPECHRLIERPTLAQERRYIMKPGSWDGSPIFRDAVVYPRVNFCTRQVLDLAFKHHFTNFRFEPMAGPFDSASSGIDYSRHPPM